jgi:hypothetical protein
MTTTSYGTARPQRSTRGRMASRTLVRGGDSLCVVYSMLIAAGTDNVIAAAKAHGIRLIVTLCASLRALRVHKLTCVRQDEQLDRLRRHGRLPDAAARLEHIS